jgi:hypothetical protein
MQPAWQQERGDMNAAAVARLTRGTPKLQNTSKSIKAAIVINTTVKNICTK